MGVIVLSLYWNQDNSNSTSYSLLFRNFNFCFPNESHSECFTLQLFFKIFWDSKDNVVITSHNSHGIILLENTESFKDVNVRNHMKIFLQLNLFLFFPPRNNFFLRNLSISTYISRNKVLTAKLRFFHHATKV